MGARLSTGRVDGDKVVCPWHGLALDKRGFRDWSCHAAHDDGVLVWVQLGSEPRTKTPPLPPRPRDGLAGVIQARGKCDPQDIIANRLDPWHGAWFHPYSFGDLEVLDTRDDVLRLRVSYRAFGPVYVEVDATFHCPGPRTIVMTIVDGEGVGSVVETHATPVRPGVTLMTEATLATSDRTGFRVARRFAPALRPFIERAAARLWVDDIAYAERRYDLRTAAASDASGRDGQMPVARPRAGTE